MDLGGSALASDDAFVYVGGASLVRVPVSGGEAQVLHTLPPAEGDELSLIETIAVGPSDLVIVIATLDPNTLQSSKTLMRVPKSGATPTTLDSSTDSRAYRGVALDGPDVYYSTHTALLRLPLAGGQPTFVGESPGTILHWVLTPTIIGETIYWAEDNAVFRIRKGDPDREGELVAQLSGRTSIIGADDQLVVTIQESGYDEGIKGIVEIDLATGIASPEIPFRANADDAVATETDVWVPSFDGLFRVPRDGSAPEQITSEGSFLVTATPDAVFAIEESGITRIAR